MQLKNSNNTKENTHQKPMVTFPDEEESPAASPFNTMEREIEKEELTEDIEQLINFQITLDKPSRFPFLVLKDIEAVFGHVYIKMRQCFLLPEKDTSELPSPMFQLVDSFIKQERPDKLTMD